MISVRRLPSQQWNLNWSIVWETPQFLIFFLAGSCQFVERRGGYSHDIAIHWALLAPHHDDLQFMSTVNQSANIYMLFMCWTFSSSFSFQQKRFKFKSIFPVSGQLCTLLQITTSHVQHLQVNHYHLTHSHQTESGAKKSCNFTHTCQLRRACSVYYNCLQSKFPKL